MNRERQRLGLTNAAVIQHRKRVHRNCRSHRLQSWHTKTESILYLIGLRIAKLYKLFYLLLVNFGIIVYCIVLALATSFWVKNDPGLL